MMSSKYSTLTGRTEKKKAPCSGSDEEELVKQTGATAMIYITEYMLLK